MAAITTIIDTLAKRTPSPSLFPTQVFDADMSRHILSSSDEECFGDASKVLSAQQKSLLRAGLLVWNDDIDAAHPIVQDIENPTGSFWHAIIHRREGDASNFNYWWRRTGEHPAFADVLQAAQSTLGAQDEVAAQEFLKRLDREKRWLPIEFVTLCEHSRQEKREDEWLRRVQVAEIESLMKWCRSNHN